MLMINFLTNEYYFLNCCLLFDLLSVYSWKFLIFKFIRMEIFNHVSFEEKEEKKEKEKEFIEIII